MMRLLIADTKRFYARRMTLFFPAAIALLMIAGIVIAYFVIENGDSNPDFVNDMAGGVSATAILGPVANLLPVMAFVIGASFIGADLKTGMLEQILTWEPRRPRIVASRAIAALVNVGLISAFLAAFLVALLFGLAVAIDTSSGTTGELWLNIAAAIARTAVACGLFAVIGIGITLFVWNSVGSIVGFLIYWFILESFLISTFLPKVAVWLPITNASSFASGADVERIEGSVFSGDFEIVSHHGYRTAGVVLLIWALACGTAGVVRLLQRDID
ncbi:MAG: hypothetical protein R2733_16470 [Acidimicrobiales bacterium]